MRPVDASKVPLKMTVMATRSWTKVLNFISFWCNSLEAKKTDFWWTRNLNVTKSNLALPALDMNATLVVWQPHKTIALACLSPCSHGFVLGEGKVSHLLLQVLGPGCSTDRLCFAQPLDALLGTLSPMIQRESVLQWATVTASSTGIQMSSIQPCSVNTSVKSHLPNAHPVLLLWFRPSQQLHTIPLAHSVPSPARVAWGGKWRECRIYGLR